MPARLIMKTHRNRVKRGFTVIELLIVIACLAVLAAIILPAIAKTKARSSRLECVNNLKQIGLSFRIWALNNGDNYPMQVSVTNEGTMELVQSGTVFAHFLVMSNELSTPKILMCQQEKDSRRKTATTFASIIAPSSPNQIPFSSDLNVSYFIGVDANPTQLSMWLCGDRNLVFDGVAATHGLHSIWSNSVPSWVKPRHANAGNIGFADGNVQQFRDSGLRSSLRATGMATNRLAVP